MTDAAAGATLTLIEAPSSDAAEFDSVPDGLVSTGDTVSTGTIGVSSAGTGSDTEVGTTSGGGIVAVVSTGSGGVSTASSDPAVSVTVDEVSAPPELRTIVNGPGSVGEVAVDGSDTFDTPVPVEGFAAGAFTGFDDPSGAAASDGELADDSDDAELESSASARPGVLPT